MLLSSQSSENNDVYSDLTVEKKGMDESMKNLMKKITALFVSMTIAVSAASVSFVWAESSSSAPVSGQYWMMPKNSSFDELFSDVSAWKNTYPVVDMVGFADHALHNLYDDATLASGFAAMNNLGIPLMLEVGAIKEWSGGCYGQAIFDVESPMWSRFMNLGADLKGVTFDEPLVNVMEMPTWDYLGDDAAKFEFAVEQTAEFIKIIRQNYPGMLIGDIEVLPHFTSGFVIEWIDALEARLAQKGVAGQDYFSIDLNWAAFEHAGYTQAEGWAEVKAVEDHCKSIGLPFNLIYWSADVTPYVDGFGNAIMDERSDIAWYNQIMFQGEGYYTAGGRPDNYIVETWVTAGPDSTPMPPTTVPDTLPHSFTSSVADFYYRFVADMLEPAAPRGLETLKKRAFYDPLNPPVQGVDAVYFQEGYAVIENYTPGLDLTDYKALEFDIYVEDLMALNVTIDDIRVGFTADDEKNNSSAQTLLSISNLVVDGDWAHVTINLDNLAQGVRTVFWDNADFSDIRWICVKLEKTDDVDTLVRIANFGIRPRVPGGTAPTASGGTDVIVNSAVYDPSDPPTQGVDAIYFQEGFAVIENYPTGMDISGYDTLEFDMYVEDLAALNATVADIRINLNSDDEKNSSSVQTLLSISNLLEDERWFHVSIDLETFIPAGTVYWDNADFSDIRWICIKMEKTNDIDSVIRIANLGFGVYSSVPAVPAVPDGLTQYTPQVSNPIVKNPTFAPGNEYNFVKYWPAPDLGHNLDLTAFRYIEFDMYARGLEKLAIAGGDVRLAFISGDDNGPGTVLRVSNLLIEGDWAHVKIDMGTSFSPATVLSSGVDLSDIFVIELAVKSDRFGTAVCMLKVENFGFSNMPGDPVPAAPDGLTQYGAQVSNPVIENPGIAGEYNFYKYWPVPDLGHKLDLTAFESIEFDMFMQGMDNLTTANGEVWLTLTSGGDGGPTTVLDVTGLLTDDDWAHVAIDMTDGFNPATVLVNDADMSDIFMIELAVRGNRTDVVEGFFRLENFGFSGSSAFGGTAPSAPDGLAQYTPHISNSIIVNPAVSGEYNFYKYWPTAATGSTLDLSGFQYIEFDMYAEGLSSLDNVGGAIALAFTSVNDNGPVTFLVVNDLLVEGDWAHVVIDMADGFDPALVLSQGADMSDIFMIEFAVKGDRTGTASCALRLENFGFSASNA